MAFHYSTYVAFSHGSNDLFRSFDKILHVVCMQNISYFLCFVCSKGHRKYLLVG